MKRFPTLARWAVYSIALLFSTVASAADLSADARAIFERYIQASGGRERIESIDSLRMSGTMTIPAMGMNATMTTTLVYPDKGYTKQVIPGMGEFVQAYDGAKGWAQDPMQGFRQLSPEEIDATKGQQGGVREVLEYESKYASATVMPDADVDGKPVSVLKVVVAETGKEETHYYSKDTGYLCRIEMVAEMGTMGEMPVTMTLSDLSEHEGLVFPQKISVTNPAMTIEMHFDTFEVNPSVEPSLFLPPQ